MSTRFFSVFRRAWRSGHASYRVVGLTSIFGLFWSCNVSLTDGSTSTGGLSDTHIVRGCYNKGMLKVSNLHSISYSCFGNPVGKPVLIVHGGPGGSCNPDMTKYFDQQHYRIIMVDQRGCGDSYPYGELRENTMQDLIEDFEKLRVHLGIQKWQLFGGSWGSTLSLAYAMAYPDRVSELILRGVFACRKTEVDWFYKSPGAGYIFPEDWTVFEGAIPEMERDDLLSAYHRRLSGDMGQEEMYKAAEGLSVWGSRATRLRQTSEESVKTKIRENREACLGSCRLLMHYTVNGCFLPSEGYLLDKENLKRICHIPTVIVQGRYDVMCPARTAYELHQALPLSDLIVTVAGHSAADQETVRELKKATDRFKTLT